MKHDAALSPRMGLTNAVVIYPLTERDGALAEKLLQSAGIRCVIVKSLDAFCLHIADGVGAALVTEEAIENDQGNLIRRTLAQQPPWSDLPILILTRGGADSPVAARALEELGNVILLERPVRINALLSATRAAIRARHRQYQIRDYLIERETAERVLRDQRNALTEQARKLARSNKDLEDFAYISSHDLQEPLRKVASFVGLLETNLAGRLDDAARHYLDVVTSGVLRMSSLIQDLLTYSRATQTNEKVGVVDVNEVVDQVTSDLDMAIHQQRAKVTRTHLPRVRGNASQLRHLFQNLIGNALKFRGGPDPVVEISAQTRPEEVRFCVRDNGIGLDMQYGEQIFEVFRRLHPRDKYAGTGIGLAICKKIVERYGGKIWVEASPGAGSAFFFTFPAAGEAS